MNTKLNRRSFLRSFGRVALAGSAAALWLPRRALANSSIVLVSSLNNTGMLNSTWARSVTLPASWSKIRLGLLHHMPNASAGTNITGTPGLYLGFCHLINPNQGNLIGDATTDHFVGVFTNSATWTYNAGASCPANNALFFNIVMTPVVNVAGTPTTGSNIATDWITSACDGLRTLTFLDVTKGSPNYTLNLYGNTSGSAADVTIGSFLTNVALSSPGLSGYGFQTSQTIAVNEGSNGTLNAVNVYWNRADVQFNWCALAVAVLA